MHLRHDYVRFKLKHERMHFIPFNLTKSPVSVQRNTLLSQLTALITDISPIYIQGLQKGIKL